MPVYLVSYAKRMLYSEQLTVLLAGRHLNTMILTNFENVNSILNIFQETHNFIVLTEPVIIGIYFRTTDRQFVTREYPPSHLKVIKMRFVPYIKYLSEPFFADFNSFREGLSCLDFNSYGQYEDVSYNADHIF